jgi:hypothetical protein
MKKSEIFKFSNTDVKKCISGLREVALLQGKIAPVNEHSARITNLGFGRNSPSENYKRRKSLILLEWIETWPPGPPAEVEKK